MNRDDIGAMPDIRQSLPENCTPNEWNAYCNASANGLDVSNGGLREATPGDIEVSGVENA
jgi:hypothetical protein